MISAVDLYPTSSKNPDPKQIATGVLDLDEFEDAQGKIDSDSPVRLAVECECVPGSPEAEQFQSLVIEVHAHGGGKVYEGPLAALDAELLRAKKTTLKVWLADTGKPQPQGVTTQFSFIATAKSG